MTAPHRVTWLLAASLLAAAPVSTLAAAVEEPTAPPPAPAVSSPLDASLDGRAIYDRVLDNRFDSYIEDLSMHSGDRGGNIQNTVMRIKYRSFKKESDRIVSKVIMKYEAPQDVRHLGYLVINKQDGSEDQFVYRPSSRRVQRVNLRGEAIFGTDFAFEDLIPQEIEDATYERLADAEHEGHPVYTVRVIPKETADSEYSKMEVLVSAKTFVPLRIEYWDQDELKIKELTTDRASIQMFEHEEDGELKQIHLAMKQKIVHLRLESWTELTVSSYDPTQKLTSRHFSQRELTKGR